MTDLTNLTLAQAAELEPQFSAVQRDTAVREFVQSNSLVQASLAAGAPLALVRHWARQQWWAEALVFLESERDSGLLSQLDALQARAVGVLMDRLETGDTVTLQNGQQVLQPVPARDAAKIFEVAAVQRRGITRRSQGSDANTRMEALNRLAGRLEQIGGTLGRLAQQELSHDSD